MDWMDCVGSKTIKVMVSHGVGVLREGLASVLCRWPEIVIVEMPPEEGCPEEVPRSGSVDVILLEAIHPSDTMMVERIRRLHSTFAGAKVIIIGVPESGVAILGCIEAGAAGYTLLDSSLDHLVDTIRRVHRGEASCPPDILALLFERLASLKFHLGSIEGSDLSKLTAREIEILRLVSEGMSNREIGENLHLELQTVKNYVHSILEKLKVHNRREAAMYLTTETSRYVKSHSTSIANTTEA